MKAIVVKEFGGPDVLRIEDVPQPKPGKGQVLVRLKAAGVNPYDTYMRAGQYAVKPPLPYTPGSDGAGIVEAVGEGVTLTKPGDRVYIAGSISGAYAQFALTQETQVHALSERVSFAQGAAVYVPYATAFRALEQKARALPGETVLIHGASGGVGVAAIQIARARGMRVIGTAGTQRGRDLAAREGAHHVLDHRSGGYRDEILSLTGGKGVNVILEMLANVNLGADLRLLADGGRVVVIGSRGEATINPRDAMARDASVIGMMLWKCPPEEEAVIHAALVAGLANGTLGPVVGKELPLAQAAEAHRAIMEPGAYGKIVLIP